MSQNVSTDQSWTPDDCARLLAQLRPSQQLEFYAADHVSPTDSGAYIWIQRDEAGQLLRKAANHGWSLRWLAAEPLSVQNELHRNQTVQAQGIRIIAARRAHEGDR